MVIPVKLVLLTVLVVLQKTNVMTVTVKQDTTKMLPPKLVSNVLLTVMNVMLLMTVPMLLILSTLITNYQFLVEVIVPLVLPPLVLNVMLVSSFLKEIVPLALVIVMIALMLLPVTLVLMDSGITPTNVMPVLITVKLVLIPKNVLMPDVWPTTVYLTSIISVMTLLRIKMIVPLTLTSMKLP